MAEKLSTMLPLGTVMPHFALPDADGVVHSSDRFRGAPLVVAFICGHCPYVAHIRRELAAFGREYQARGLSVVAIMPNDVDAYPEDGPAGMKAEAAEAGYTFPYLYDADQAVARAFRAACTPDLFLFDAAGRLVYRGQFDGSRPGNRIPVTGADLRTAADAVLAGDSVPEPQKASIGCSIKWKPGNEPGYA